MPSGATTIVIVVPDGKEEIVKQIIADRLKAVAPVFITSHSMEQVAVQKMISDAVDEAGAVVMKEYLPKIADLMTQVDYWKKQAGKAQEKNFFDDLGKNFIVGIFSGGAGYLLGRNWK